MTLPHDIGTSPPEDAVVVVLSASVADTSGVTHLINGLCASPKRLSVVLVAVDTAEAPGLAKRFPNAFVHVAQPDLILSRLRARSALWVHPDGDLPKDRPRLVSRSIRRGIPVFALSTECAQVAANGIADQPLVALSRSAADILPDIGDVAMIVDHLISAMGAERGDGPIIGAVARAAQRLMRGSGRALLAPLARRISSCDALRNHLNQPQTIMCLGNGPSSADPRLKDMAHDALFRVNHQWMEDGYMTGADVIFAGVKRSMRAAGRVPIGVASLRKEQALLGTRLLAPWRGRFTYLVAEEIADMGNALRGHPRPTTGAVMLAVAIALAPQRLIVAGMDMFADKAGAYPGRSDAVNAYAAAHDRATDAAFIRTHLARYEGEIVTLSPAFAELASTVKESRFTLLETVSA